MKFGKGHGTENDFVLIPDLEVRVDLTVKAVTALCDRRRGLGADGVLRIARTGQLRDAGVLRVVPPGIADDDWFMDYRNADGSIAEMCGNGVRVFAHYLRAHGLEDRDRFVVGSRAGARPVTVNKVEDARADVTVGMGDLALLGASSAQLSDRTFDGIGIDVGNPHLACVDPALTPSTLRTLDFSAAPQFDREFFPDGVNFEVLTRLDRGRVDMRVYERGVGETRSCGTGTVAAAAAALSYEGRDNGEVTVGVLGGEVFVTIDDDGAHLRGPSVLVASGVVDDGWLHDIS